MARPSRTQGFMWFCFATAFLLVSFQLRPSSGTAENTVAPEVAMQNRLIIDLSDRKVYVYQSDSLQTNYDIAIGRDGWETPIGDHKITVKATNPQWQHPFTNEIIPGGSPDNPLGTRWIEFWTDGKHQIGFHGTNKEGLVGTAVSHGCVRMRNQDIETLFNTVQLDTPVIVQE
jgi:L,D-transpeptidase ErfK/SrfK